LDTTCTVGGGDDGVVKVTLRRVIVVVSELSVGGMMFTVFSVAPGWVPLVDVVSAINDGEVNAVNP
jgi:hypothetical protein